MLKNFQINMNNINNLGNYKYAKGSKEEPKQEETKNAEPEKAKVKTEEEKKNLSVLKKNII